MTPKERFFACLKKDKYDRIPVLAYHFLLPRGELERKFREAGCGLLTGVPIYDLVFPSNIVVEEKRFWEGNERVIVRTYTTPVGSLRELATIGPYESEWKREHFIKKPEDYKVVAYLLEKVTFKEKIEDFLRADYEMGGDGVVVPMLPLFERSPFQKILIDLAGPERTLIDLYDQPQELETLMECFLWKLEEAIDIYQQLPEKHIFWWVDNVTADLTTPQLFKNFCLPVYQRYLAPLRKEGIFCMIHLDGKLRALKELIKEAPIDVVESFTFPEQGGDLTAEEAHAMWCDKVIAANIPANLAYANTEGIKEFFRSIFERRWSQERFILELSEDLPREHLGKVISALFRVLQNSKKEGY